MAARKNIGLSRFVMQHKAKCVSKVTVRRGSEKLTKMSLRQSERKT